VRGPIPENLERRDLQVLMPLVRLGS